MSRQTQPALRCWAEIDLAALERNLKRIRAALPDHVSYVAVVKADAYGHGIHQTAARLMQSGVDMFAVANVSEAAALREIGSGWPILILSALLPSELPALFEHDLIATVSTVDEANRIEALAAGTGAAVKVHMKIDTGMGRLGVWHESAMDLFNHLKRMPKVLLQGVYSHYSSADTDPEYTRLQRSRFLQFIDQLEPADRDALVIHADNSASIDSFSADAPFNAVRVGLLQFGVPPYPDSVLGAVAVEPVLSFFTRIGITKELPAGTSISYGRTAHLDRAARIGVLTAGYGDGVPIALSNKGEVLINGIRCPILGRVTMDQTIVDLSALGPLEAGTPVTLIGSDRDDRISVVEFSQRANTIPWETLCSITKRVPRVYRQLREL